MFKPLLISLLTAALLTACDKSEQGVAANITVAENYFSEKEFNKAEEFFLAALKKDADSIPALFGLARVALIQHKFPAARQYFQQIIDINPNEAEALMLLGQLSAQANDLEKVEEIANLLAENEFNNPKVLTTYISLIGYLKQESEKNSHTPLSPTATKKIVHFTELEPEVGIAAAKFYALNGEFLLAETVAKSYREHFPEEQALYQQLMYALYAQKRYSIIETTFNNYIDERPSLNELYFLLIEFYIKRDNISKAFSVAQRLQHQGGVNEEVATALAKIYLQMGKNNYAISFLEDYERNNPNAWSISLLLAEQYSAQGHIQKAKKIYEQLLKRHPISESSPLSTTLISLSYASHEFQRGEYTHAKQLVNDILAVQPNNTIAKVINAKLDVEEKEFRGAIEQTLNLMKTHPEFLPAINVLAKAYIGLGEVQSAISLYKEALKSQPNSQELAFKLIQTLGDADLHTQANQEAINWLQSHPNDTRIIQLQGLVAIDGKNYSRLFTIAERLEKLEGKTGFSEFLKGVAITQTNDLNQAVSLFKNSVRLDPNNYSATSGLAKLLIAMNKPDAAIRFFQNLPKKTSATVYAEGQTQLQQKKFKAAQHAFETAIEYNPREFRHYPNLVNAYYLDGNTKAALSTINIAISLFPANSVLRFQQAGIFLDEGETQKALLSYKRAVDLNPKNYVAANNYLSLLSDKGKNEEIISAMPIADNLSAITAPNVHDTLGWYYFKANDLYRANLYIDRALEQLPNNASVNYHAGMIYYAQNRRSEAKALLEKATKLGAEESWHPLAKQTLLKLN